MVVIKAMLGKVTPMDFKLETIITREGKETSSFMKISLFHVKRFLNTIVSWWANIATNLEIGIFLKNKGSIIFI
jgi:hypothetical protein